LPALRGEFIPTIASPLFIRDWKNPSLEAMTRLKRAERELSPEKTEAILDGAMQEFLTHGYAATSMDKVASTSKVSKATIYSHFQDKEGLFKALIHRLAERKQLFAQEALQDSLLDPAACLRQYAHCMLNNVGNDPQVLTFFRIIIGESGRFPDLARTFVESLEKPALMMLTQYLAEHPDVTFPDPEVMARTFVGTMVHFVLIRDILQSGDILPMEHERLLENLLALILRSEP